MALLKQERMIPLRPPNTDPNTDPNLQPPNLISFDIPAFVNSLSTQQVAAVVTTYKTRTQARTANEAKLHANLLAASLHLIGSYRCP